jgi:hypothetical protein
MEKKGIGRVVVLLEDEELYRLVQRAKAVIGIYNLFWKIFGLQWRLQQVWFMCI